MSSLSLVTDKYYTERKDKMKNVSYKAVVYEDRTIQLNDFTPIEVDESIDWLDHFKEKGWTSVKLEGWNEGFIEEFRRLIDEGVIGFDLKYPNSGLIKHNFGQTELQWKIRELVYPYFTKLEKSDDLLVSFDGGCYMKPNPNYAIKKVFKDWTHHDDLNSECNPYNHRLTQGLVNFLDSGPEDGGLVLMDTRDVFEQYTAEDLNRFVDRIHPLLVSKPFYKICVKTGCLVLWDVRCFHMNIPPIGERERMCIYTLFQPRHIFSAQDLLKRIQLYEQGKQSWEDVDSSSEQRPRVASLNPLRRKLIGYTQE